MSSFIQLRAFQEANGRYVEVYTRARRRLSLCTLLFSLESEDRCHRIAGRAFMLRYKKLMRGFQ